MKIVLVSMSANTQLSGVSRHIANAARSLLLHAAPADIHVIAGAWEARVLRHAIGCDDSRLHIHSVPPSNGSMARNVWFYVDLPKIAAQLQADVVHLSYPAPLRKESYSCPTVVSLHDLYPYDMPENWGFPKVLFNRLILKQCLGAADAVACVSDATVDRLCHSPFPQIARKAIRIYNCVEPVAEAFTHSPLPLGARTPFLLCVAQHRRNKNIPFAIRVFARLLRDGDIDAATLLAIVGIAGPETSHIHQSIRESGLTQKVVLLSGISNSELQWCYRNCQVLLAPSIVEGFGLPVAEALLAGCRVVCSDIASFRELGGHHCRYVQIGNGTEEAFATAVRLSLREQRQAPVAFPKLCASTIAQEYMALYRRLIRPAKSPLPEANRRDLHLDRLPAGNLGSHEVGSAK